VLRAHGYRDGDHVAHQITAEEIGTGDLVIAMEPLHIDRMRRLGDVDTALEHGRIGLLTDFDPDAEPGSGVPDPWYGGAEGFEDTLAAVEAAVPGVLDRVRQLQEQAADQAER
jgi:protein-tyrosine phosphatase